MTDKVLHFLGGAIIVLVFGTTIGLPLVVLVGIGKEIYDHFYGGTVEVLDALATIAGGAFCALAAGSITI